MAKLKKPALLDHNDQIVESDGIMALNTWAHVLAEHSTQKVIMAGMGRPTAPIDEYLTKSMIESWKSIDDKKQPIDYTVSAGEKLARKTIARSLTRLYKFDENNRIRSNNILFTAGGALALASIFMAINADNPDGRIITTSPYYPLHKGHDGKNRFLTINVMNLPGYRLTSTELKSKILSAKKLAIHDKHSISAFVFCYPNNPTGIALREDEWKDIARVIVSDESLNNIPIILDESYAELSMIPHCSLLSVAPELENQIILLRSATKGFSAAGVRIAVVACKNPTLLSKVKTWHTNLIGHADRITSKGYADAMDHFNDASQQKIVNFYSPIVQNVERRLEEIGAAMPDKSYKVEGAFYVLADLGDLINIEIPSNAAFPGLTKILDDESLAYYLLFEHKIMVAPFSYFGGHPTKGIVRITCSDMKDSSELLDRLESILANIRQKKSQQCLESILKLITNPIDNYENLSKEVDYLEGNLVNAHKIQSRAFFESIKDLLATIKNEFGDYYRDQIREMTSPGENLPISYAKHNKIVLEKLKDLSLRISEYRKWKSMIIGQLIRLSLFNLEKANAIKNKYILFLENEKSPSEQMRKTECYSKKLRKAIALAEWERWENLVDSTNIISEDFTHRDAWNMICSEKLSQFEKNAKANILIAHIAHLLRIDSLFKEIENMPGIPFDLSNLNQNILNTDQTIWNKIGHYLSHDDLSSARATSYLFFKCFTPLWDLEIQKRQTISAVVATHDNSFLITESRHVYVSGSNKEGKSGVDKYCFSQLTWHRLNITHVRSVVAGYQDTYIVTTTGRLFGCGINSAGELGLHHTDPVKSMTVLTSILDIKAIAVTTDFGYVAMLVTQNGDLYDAGLGFHGRSLDIQYRRNTLGWRKITTLNNVITIDGGYYFFIALTRDNRAFGIGEIAAFLTDPEYALKEDVYWHEFLPGKKITQIASNEDDIILSTDNGSLYRYVKLLEFEARYVEGIQANPIVYPNAHIVEMYSSKGCIVVRNQSGKIYITLSRAFHYMSIPPHETHYETRRQWFQITNVVANIRTIVFADQRCLALTENQELMVCGPNENGELGLNHRKPQLGFTRSNFSPFTAKQSFFSKRTLTFEQLVKQREKVFLARPKKNDEDINTETGVDISTQRGILII